MYVPHSEPYEHQQRTFLRLRDEKVFALFHEQGTGKTKILLDNAADLYERGKIDALIVVADNGIHRNWITDEIPEHWPPRIKMATFIWRSSKANGKGYQALFDNLLKLDMIIFAMNIDAVITPNGWKALTRILKERRVMMVVDESTSIKTPGAKRTRAIVKAGRHALYRRIATGTPVAEGPFNLFSPFQFLDPNIIGTRSFYAFKTEFGVWRKETRPSDGRSYPVLMEYRNLDILMNRVAPYSDRVLKRDCLDLPPKVFQKRYFELTKEQRRDDALRTDRRAVQLVHFLATPTAGEAR